MKTLPILFSPIEVGEKIFKVPTNIVNIKRDKLDTKPEEDKRCEKDVCQVPQI